MQRGTNSESRVTKSASRRGGCMAVRRAHLRHHKRRHKGFIDVNDSITPPMARYGAVQPYLQQELLDVRSEGNVLQQNNTSPHVNTVLKQSASCSIHVAPQKLQRRSKSTCCPATITTVTPTSAPNCQRNVVQLPARTHRNANRFRIKWLSNCVAKGHFSTCCVFHVWVRRQAAM